MTKFKHSPSSQDKTTQVAYWGTLILAAILFLVSAGVFLLTISALSAVPTSGKDGTVIAYIVAVIMAIIAGMNIASGAYIIRGNQGMGYRLTSLSVAMFVLSVVSMVQGQALFMSFLLLILSAVGIGWLCPPQAKRIYIIGSVISFMLVWAIEIINPQWRVAYAGAQLGPIAAIIFALIFAVLVALQTWGRSMRNKLLVSFIGVALVTAGTLSVYVYKSTSSNLQQSLERGVTEHTDEVAARIGALLNEQVNTMKILSLNEVLERTTEDTDNTYKGNASAIQTILEERDLRWHIADDADNDFAPIVRSKLTNEAAVELQEFQKAFPNNVEIFITDMYGGLAGSTNRTSDYYQADEDWWQAAYNNGNGAVYISEPEYDESSNSLVVLIASPIRNRRTGEISGILRTTYLTSALSPILGEAVGRTGGTDLILPGEFVYHFLGGWSVYEPLRTGLFNELQAVADQGMVEMDYENSPSVVVQSPVHVLEGNPAVNKLGWMVVYHQQQSEAFAPVNSQTRGALIVIAIVLIIAVAAAFVLSLILVRPITQLTQTAEEVAAGNLDSRAKVTSTDEIGILASTFNNMTAQLHETLGGLEQRVAARTRDLATVAEVGTATATILESKRLLQEVVDLTKERFNLYHSHIYLLDAEGKNLVLAAGAGEAGRIMLTEGRSIPLDREQSLVARAARERKGVTVNDVTQAADFLPNPLLPDTHSELAVPMIVGGNVIGVFDIQSEQVGRFTDADVNIQTTLAAQLATSIQNVRTYEQSRRQAELESLANAIGQKLQRTTSIEETLQIASRELGTAIGASRVKAQIGGRNDNN